MNNGYSVSGRLAEQEQRSAVPGGLVLIWYDKGGKERSVLRPPGARYDKKRFIRDAVAVQKGYDRAGLDWSCPVLEQLLQLETLNGA